jgi:deoxyhypusine synthase
MVQPEISSSELDASCDDLNLVPLKLLDLGQCDSVGTIVQGMNQCSFGARMLGEVTGQIQDWIVAGKPPMVIYDGPKDGPLGQLLQTMVDREWFSQILSQQDYASQAPTDQPMLVLGAYSEAFSPVLANHQGPLVFINPYGLALPGQLQDGYYPNAVFCDPSYILPVIFACLRESLGGEKVSVSQFIQELPAYGGLAADVHRGAQTLLAMVEDPDCTVFLTLSGAMTIAKMGLVICDMIDLGMVNVICTTGALMTHGLVESVGLSHFKYNPTEHKDTELAKRKIDRVTDTLELDTNLNHLGDLIYQVLIEYKGKELIGTRRLFKVMGKYLAKNYPNDRSMLKSAYDNDVSVIVPAFYDSELGNDVYFCNLERKDEGLNPICLNTELDSAHLLRVVGDSTNIGIFTVGGGVPRNFVQNIPPLIDWINSNDGPFSFPERKFLYGCRICPDPAYYGHLSGCSYSEGVSWRKMDPNGQFSEMRSDATQVWPFLVKFVMENRTQKPEV